ncbi:MAG: ABC transporter substrate-binding protein [Deltaproteobacteria bacterium]|nr:ABC transporter substrate-binding protein [Deltaproteobacteria bacterium]
MKTYIQRIASSVLGALLLVSCHMAPSFAANISVRITQSTVGPDALPYWAALEHGFFRKHGIDVEIIYVRSGANQAAGLVSGGVQFANLGGAPVIATAPRGANLKFIAMTRQNLKRQIVARPEIKDAQDLVGKSVGVTNLGGTSWLVTVLGLEHLKLDPARHQIRFRALGSYPVIVQGLENRVIDAAVVDRVFSRHLAQKGFKVLGEFNPASAAGLVVTGKYLEENFLAAENVVKCVIEGQAYVTNPANKPSVLKMFRDRLKINDPAIIESGYEDIVGEHKREPYPNVDGLRVFQRIMKSQSPEVAQVRVEELVDERIVRKLDTGGFIAKVYDYSVSR